MIWRHYLLLFFISTAVFIVTARIQTVPGYMDADYYYLGGLQLAKGEGFTEPILWNYLDDPDGIPHPSHGYWMPLTSIVSAAGMWLVGVFKFEAARSGFLLLAVAVPLVTAALAFQFSGRVRWAFISGLLGIFSGYYLPYVTTTDTFPIYMVLGGLLFLFLPKIFTLNKFAVFSAGIMVGLLHLSRADGIIWLLVIPLLFIAWRNTHSSSLEAIRPLILFFFGYLLVMSPWMWRNLNEFGTFLSPGGLRTLWLVNYDQLFSYPATQLTFRNWWSSGIVEILKTRYWALGVNLQRTLAEQGLVFLTPLVALGMWRYRSDVRVQTGFWAWLLTFGLMTVVFPFAGSRGGLFHSCAVIQPLFWAVAPLGLEVFIEWGGHRRGWKQDQASLVFGSALVVLAVVLSGALYYQRVIGPESGDLIWEKSASEYNAIEHQLQILGAREDDIVMVKNPPGYYVENTRSAIVIPDGDLETLISVANRYGARYLLLDQDHPDGLKGLYEDPHKTPRGMLYLQTLQGTHIFKIK